MRYLKKFWKMKKSSNAANRKSLESNASPFNHDGSSSGTETECWSTDTQISGSNALKLNHTISSESESSSDGYRISLFSDPSLRKDNSSHYDMEKYNKNGISPLELDQSLKMRAYRMSIYIM